MASQLWSEEAPATSTTSVTTYSALPFSAKEGEASRTDDPTMVELDFPNEETISAIEDAMAGRVESFESMEDMFRELRS